MPANVSACREADDDAAMAPDPIAATVPADYEGKGQVVARGWAVEIGLAVANELTASTVAVRRSPADP